MAIVWTHLFSAADNGTILFGQQIGQIQADISAKFAGGITNADINVAAAIAEAKVAFDITNGHNHDGVNSRTITNPGASNYRSGLDVNYSTATNLLVRAGKLNFDGNATVTKAANTSVDVTSAGNFLTGSGPAINQHTWAVINQAGTIKLTAQAPNVSNAGVNTDGLLQYRDFVGVFYRYLGSVRTDGAGNILPFIRAYQNVIIYNDSLSVLVAGASVAFAAVSLASRVPPTSKMAWVGRAGNGQTDNTANFLRATGGPGNGLVYLGAGDTWPGIYGWVPTNSAQSIDYKITAGTINLEVGGFLEDLE